jgi:hypothetical protein
MVPIHKEVEIVNLVSPFSKQLVPQCRFWSIVEHFGV